VPALDLRSFYEKVSGMLSGERDTESDNEVNGTGVQCHVQCHDIVAGVLRRIRWASREYMYQQATPSPQGKLRDRSPSQGDPAKGMSSKTKNAASRRLHDQLDPSPDVPSETSGSSDLMQALRGHFVAEPSSSTKKKLPHKKTPINLYQAILDSLKGAADIIGGSKGPSSP
jgi:hypothetical protein